MTGRDVERVEIIEARFDLRAVLDRVTHRDKHIFDPLPNKRDRMKMTLPGSRARQSDIDLLALERACFGLRRKLLVETRDLRFDLRADLIHLTAELSALFRRERTDAFLLGGDQSRLSA